MNLKYQGQEIPGVERSVNKKKKKERELMKCRLFARANCDIKRMDIFIYR
jgi:hypothetical protein